ncbi:MAG: hypothetical protein C5B49_01310 [Bdellovibrio sp.]|nr:MAG: hypothetical protein C5B49_01310 [Bdellovibrio sp.]
MGRGGLLAALSIRSQIKRKKFDSSEIPILRKKNLLANPPKKHHFCFYSARSFFTSSELKKWLANPNGSTHG